MSSILSMLDIARATVVLSDNFSSGNLNNWMPGTNLPTVISNVTNAPNNSTFAAEVPLSPAQCYAYKTIEPTATLNYTYYLYVGGLCSNYTCVVIAQDSASNRVFYRIQYTDGTYIWQFNAGNGQVTNSSTPTVQLGQWYKIQLLALAGSSNSTFYFLVNDDLKATITNETFGKIDQLRIGTDWDDGYIGGNLLFSGVTATDITSPVIVVSAGAGGSITPSGAVSVPFGGSQSFNIIANTGYHIADVKVDGA